MRFVADMVVPSFAFLFSVDVQHNNGFSRISLFNSGARGSLWFNGYGVGLKVERLPVQAWLVHH